MAESAPLIIALIVSVFLVWLYIGDPQKLQTADGAKSFIAERMTPGAPIEVTWRFDYQNRAAHQKSEVNRQNDQRRSDEGAREERENIDRHRDRERDHEPG